jgi:hypothetical protein
VLFAAVLMGAALPAAAKAAPNQAGPAPARWGGEAVATRLVGYRITHSRKDDPAFAFGVWSWTDNKVTNRGTLIDTGDGYAALGFIHTMADGTKVTKGGGDAENGAIRTDYELTGKVTEITVSLCKAGGASATTCVTKTYTRGGR